MPIAVEQWFSASAALLIIVLAGMSESFGTDGMLLFLRRINRRSFLASLLFSGVAYAAGAIAWITTIWLIAQRFVAEPIPLQFVVQHVGSGYVPLLFTAFAIAPYIGPLLLYTLHAWSLLIVTAIVRQTYGIPLWQAGLLVGCGWLLAQLARRLAQRPNRALRRVGWRLLTGSPALPQLSDMPPKLALRVVPQANEQDGRR